EPAFTEKVRFLVELGLASREKVAGSCSPREVLLGLAARQTPPGGDPNDCDALRVDLRGRRDGRNVERRAAMTVLPHAVWKIAAGSLDTGVPLSIAGQLLASRAIRTPGVLCPETGVPGELFFEMLERRETRVRWS